MYMGDISEVKVSVNEPQREISGELNLGGRKLFFKIKSNSLTIQSKFLWIKFPVVLQAHDKYRLLSYIRKVCYGFPGAGWTDDVLKDFMNLLAEN